MGGYCSFWSGGGLLARRVLLEDDLAASDAWSGLDRAEFPALTSSGGTDDTPIMFLK